MGKRQNVKTESNYVAIDNFPGDLLLAGSTQKKQLWIETLS